MINQVKDLYGDVNNLNSKIASIRIKIERKFIKNEDRDRWEERVNHKVRARKFLNFHLKKDRSKSYKLSIWISDWNL